MSLKDSNSITTRHQSRSSSKSSSPATPTAIQQGKTPGRTHELVRLVQELTNQVSDISSKLDTVLEETKAYKTMSIDLNNIKQQLDQHFTSTTTNGVQQESEKQEVKYLTNLILEEKRSNITKEQALSVKRDISVFWSNCLNKRKQKFWHSIQNKGKAELYTTWKSESPTYIPLKFRPKLITDELEVARSARISEAKLAYTNSVETMLAYSEQHEKAYSELDNQMHAKIESKSDEPAITELLHEWWKADVLKNEAISHQLWEKNMTFLQSKKLLDEEEGIGELTPTLWSDIIQAKRPLKVNKNEKKGQTKSIKDPSSIQNKPTSVATKKDTRPYNQHNKKSTNKQVNQAPNINRAPNPRSLYHNNRPKNKARSERAPRYNQRYLYNEDDSRPHKPAPIGRQRNRETEYGHGHGDEYNQYHLPNNYHYYHPPSPYAYEDDYHTQQAGVPVFRNHWHPPLHQW